MVPERANPKRMKWGRWRGP